VHSLSFSSPASVLGDARFHAVLENSPYQIELYEETLQNILFSDPASQQEVRQGWHNEDRVNHAKQAQQFSGQKNRSGPAQQTFDQDFHRTPCDSDDERQNSFDNNSCNFIM
jgi:hypothetical protein